MQTSRTLSGSTKTDTNINIENSTKRTIKMTKEEPIVRLNAITAARVAAWSDVKISEGSTSTMTFSGGRQVQTRTVGPGGMKTSETTRISGSRTMTSTVTNVRMSQTTKTLVTENKRSEVTLKTNTSNRMSTPNTMRSQQSTIRSKEVIIEAPKKQVKTTANVEVIEKIADTETKQSKEIGNDVASSKSEEPLNVASAKKIFEFRNEKIIIPKTENIKVKTEEKKQEYIPVIQKDAKLKISVEPWSTSSVKIEPVVYRSIQDKKPSFQKSTSEEKAQENIEDSIREKEDAVEKEKPSTRNSIPTIEVEFVTRDSGYIDDSDISARNSLEGEVDLNRPRAIDMVRKEERKLWKNIPGNEHFSEALTKDERVRQEAKFELMLSEASFLYSLDSLKTNYMNHIKKYVDPPQEIITKKDYQILFGNILDIRECSSKFLKELDEVWQDDVMLNGMYDVVTKYATEEFKVYMQFCRNMLEMNKHLTELIDKNAKFKELLGVLRDRQGLQKLTLDAFLTTPMQRITKLPLLLKTILDKVEVGTKEHEKCMTAYEAACKVAHECDEVVTEKKKLEELLLINQQLEFPPDIKSIPIVTQGRVLLVKSKVKNFAFGDRNAKKEKLVLLLFNDLLVVARPIEGILKSGRSMTVVDHCPKDQVQIKDMDSGSLYNHQDIGNLKVVVVTMEKNSEGKKVNLVVTFKEPNMYETWIKLLTPPQDGPADEDTEQVIVLDEHEPENPDELTLSPGDVIQVLTKEVDGWCEGELLSDGSRGKFQVSKTRKIISPKMRAANMKARKELRSFQLAEELN